MGYTKNTVSGFSWHGAFIVLATGLTALKLFILARLLTPHDFGMFSLIVLALGITEALTQTGINVTIIQSKESINYFINTAWVIAIIRGFIIAIIVSLLGVAMSWYYAEPQLSFWIALAAVTPIIKGFINPAIVSFQKNLQFSRDTLYRIAILLFETTVTIVAALLLKSLNALIIGIVAAAVFEVLISFLFFRMRPRFEYSATRAATIFHNAGGLNIGAVLSYLNDNLDNFIVGKLLGIATLGYYQNSYALSHKATFGMAQALSHSTLPVFTKLADSAERLRRAFIRSLGGLVLIVSAASIPIFFFPELLVRIVLGEQWLPVATAIPWLVTAGVLHGIANLSYTVLIAKGKYFAMNTHRMAVIVVFLVLLLSIGKTYGLEGAAACVFFARLISLPIVGRSVFKVLQS